MKRIFFFLLSLYDFLDYYIKQTLSLRPDISWLTLCVGQWPRVTCWKPLSLNWLDFQPSSSPAHTFLKTLPERPQPWPPVAFESLTGAALPTPFLLPRPFSGAEPVLWL